MWEGTAKVLTATSKALLIKYGKTKEWIPISQIGLESDIRSGDQIGQVGNLVIPEWLAEKKGWAYPKIERARIQNRIESTHRELLRKVILICADCKKPLLFMLPIIRPNIQTGSGGIYVVEAYEHYALPKHRTTLNYVLPYVALNSLDDILAFRVDRLRATTNLRVIGVYKLPSYTKMEEALIKQMVAAEPITQIFPLSMTGRISSTKPIEIPARRTTMSSSERNMDQLRETVVIELDEPGRRRLK